MEDPEGAPSVNSSSIEDQSSVKSEDLPCKIKVMCSYGGKILPRPQDGQLRYVGGDSRLLNWNKGISFQEVVGKLVSMVGRSVIIKYQLPNEDLDALISVVTEEDFTNMIDEYEKMERRDSGAKLRIFLFPASSATNHNKPKSDEDSSPRNMGHQFIEAVNGMALPGNKKLCGEAGDELSLQGLPSGVVGVSSYAVQVSTKPPPIKMQRQLSSQPDRAETHRGSPRTSPKANLHEESPKQQQLPVEPPRHCYHATTPDHCQYYQLGEVDSLNSDSPRKQTVEGHANVNGNGGIGFGRISQPWTVHPCNSTGELVSWSHAHHHHRHVPGVLCDQPVIYYAPEHHRSVAAVACGSSSCGCCSSTREPWAGAACSRTAVQSPSRFREQVGVPQGQEIHVKYDQAHHHIHHRFAGENPSNGPRLTDLDNRRHGV